MKPTENRSEPIDEHGHIDRQAWQTHPFPRRAGKTKVLRDAARGYRGPGRVVVVGWEGSAAAEFLASERKA